MAVQSVRFSAGKVQYDEDTKRCTPLPHRGVISIKQSVEDPEFFDFVWSPKTSSGNVDKDELLVIPGDVSFRHVTSCKTGRVFALTFLSSGAKHLYWLQDVGDLDDLDKLTDKDVELVKKINELITPVDDDDNDDEAEPAPVKTEQAHEFRLPIANIGNVLTVEVIQQHLDKLTADQLVQLYGDALPDSIGPNPSKSDLIELVRGPFYQQAASALSEHLRKQNGAGYLLSQTFKTDYEGEGIENFLNSTRKAGKKDREGN